MNNNIINYGQHFLIDEKLIERFLELADLKDKDVIEIGSGKGILTKQLIPLVKTLTCYEIDERLKPYLSKYRKNNTNIIFSNFLNANIKKCDTIISGLPYQILEPFLKKLTKIDFHQVIIIIGKTYAYSLYRENFLDNEVRFTSILSKCFFFVNVYDDIEPNSFNPPPKTTSSIVELIKKDKITLIECQELYLFRELIEQSDKKIGNALIEALIRYYSYQGKTITKRIAKAIIDRLLINENILLKRIDNLNNNEITELYINFKNNSIHL